MMLNALDVAPVNVPSVAHKVYPLPPVGAVTVKLLKVATPNVAATDNVPPKVPAGPGTHSATVTVLVSEVLVVVPSPNLIATCGEGEITVPLAVFDGCV